MPILKGRIFRLLEQKKDQPIKLLVCSPTATKPAALEHLIQQIPNQATLSLTELLGFDQLRDALPKDSAGAVIVFVINDSKELVSVIQFLATQEPGITAGLLKVIVFSYLDNHRAVSLLRSKGAFDLPDVNLSAKAFNYKIKNAVQAIGQALEGIRKNGQDELNATKKNEVRHHSNAQRSSPEHKVIWGEPIDHPSDFWLVLNPKQARFVIGKWMINFFGPGPTYGSWVETKVRHRGETGWRFEPRDPHSNLLYKNQARWVFYGNCPEFSWEQRLWYFVSKKPSFFLYEGETLVTKKVEFLDSGEVTIGSNSVQGTQMKEAISETIESEFHLHTDRERTSESSIGEDDFAKSPVAVNAPDPQLEEAREAYEALDLRLYLNSKNGRTVETNDPVNLVELRDSQATLDIPAGLLNVGDQIELTAKLDDGDDHTEVEFCATAKLILTEDSGGNPNVTTRRAAAVCELDSRTQNYFTEMVDQLRLKREHLIVFFKKAKGA